MAKRFEIFKKHQSRYAPGVTHNLEHVFSLSVPVPLPVTLDPAEHLSYEWLPWRDAAALTISWTNRDAILALPQRLGVSAGKYARLAAQRAAAACCRHVRDPDPPFHPFL